MTKRAWIVIAIILLVPILITCIAVFRWKSNNKVVATYGDAPGEILYGKKKMYAVGEPEDYMAELGNFLGKVENSMTGAPLYTVKYDKTGEILALVNEKGTVLYTETGKLPGSAYGGKAVTALFFDKFVSRTTDKIQISVLVTLTESNVAPVEWLPDEENMPASYTLHLCYDDSAVSTRTPGRFLHFKDTGLWYYLADGAEKQVNEQIESGDLSAKKAAYPVVPVTGGTEIRLLNSLLRQGAEVEIPSSAVTTSASPAPQTPSSAVQSGAVSSGAVNSGAVNSGAVQ